MEHGTIQPSSNSTEGHANLHYEVQKSTDYSSEEIFPDVAQLRELAIHWKLQQCDPERSPRSRPDIEKILGRLIFEIVYRERKTNTNAETTFDTVSAELNAEMTQNA